MGVVLSRSGPVTRLTFDLTFNWGDPHPNKAKKLGVSALLAINNFWSCTQFKEDSTLEKKWPPMPTVDHGVYQKQKSKWNTLIL